MFVYLVHLFRDRVSKEGSVRAAMCLAPCRLALLGLTSCQRQFEMDNGSRSNATPSRKPCTIRFNETCLFILLKLNFSVEFFQNKLGMRPIIIN